MRRIQRSTTFPRMLKVEGERKRGPQRIPGRLGKWNGAPGEDVSNFPPTPRRFAWRFADSPSDAR